MIDRVKELLLMTDLQCQVYLTRVLNEYGYHAIVGREKDSTDADFIFAYPPDKQIMPVLLGILYVQRTEKFLMSR